MFDALCELKKYKKINLDNIDPLTSCPSAYGIIAERLANDINKMSKSLFKLEQRHEDFTEELLEKINENLDIAESFKKLALSKDETIKGLQIRQNGDRETIHRMTTALIDFSDKLNIIYDSILSSANSDWILQTERIKHSAELILAGIGIHETGSEKYFEESLHEAVSAVEDAERDFKEITSVELKGYMYNDRVLRKAKVIVNVLRKESEEKWEG